MREILFKAKRIDNGEWVQGFYMECHMVGSDGPDSCIVKLDGQLIVVDRDTLCQFTGLYDGTKWEDLTEEEKQTFYEEVCSEDGKSIKYQNMEDVKHLWKGKKIWENDLIECKSPNHHFISQIEWDDWCKGFMFQDTKNSACGLDAIGDCGCYRNFKVIGNILDGGFDDSKRTETN